MKVIFKYKNHPYIISIKKKVTEPELFVSTEAFVSHFEKELSNFNPPKD